MSTFGLTAAQIKERLKQATEPAYMDGFNGPDGKTKDDVIEHLVNRVDEVRADVELREDLMTRQNAIDAIGAVADVLGLSVQETPPYTFKDLLETLRDLKAQHDILRNERADAMSWTDVPNESWDEESLPKAVERLKLRVDEYFEKADQAQRKAIEWGERIVELEAEVKRQREEINAAGDEERRATVEEVRKHLDWHLDDLHTVKDLNGTGAVLRSIRTRMRAFLANLADHRPPKPTFPGGQIRTESGKVVEG